MTGLRGRRVAETVREHLTDTLQKRLSDPHLAGLVVTEKVYSSICLTPSSSTDTSPLL